MKETQNAKLKTQNDNSKVKSEDIKLRAYRFSLSVIQFVNSFPNQISYRIIADQLIRSATSIGANIVEAKSSSSRREFIKYYEIALKSANETKYWLCLCRDSFSEKRDKSNQLLQESIEISNIIAVSILTLKGKRKF